MIKPEYNYNIIKEVMGNRKLFLTSMADEEIKEFEEGTWEPKRSSYYLTWYDQGELKGLVHFENITSTTIDWHLKLLPQYWHSEDIFKFQEEAEKWLYDNTKICKIVVYTPQPCKHVIKRAATLGFEIEGVLTSAIIWRENMENLVLMSKFIRTGESYGRR